VDVARDMYLQQNPTATANDFEVLYDLDLKPLDSEQYPEDQVLERERTLRKRDAQIKLDASKARSYFEELQNKINTPVERKQDDFQARVEQDNQTWKDNMTQTIEKIDFSLDGYAPDKEKLTQQYSSIDNIVNSFKDDSGNFNYNEFVKTIEFGRNREQIIQKAIQTAQTKGENAATEKIIKEIENPSQTGSKESLNGMTAEEQAARTKLEKYVKSQSGFH